MKKILSLSLAMALASTLYISSPVAASTGTSPNETSVTALSSKATQYPNSYEMIRSTLVKGEKVGQFDPNEMSTDEVGQLIRQVVRENPEILYYKSAVLWSHGKIEFIYHLPASTIEKRRAAINAEADRIIQTIIKPNFTDFDKVKAVHDYLVLNTAYDLTNQQNRTIPFDSYTAHGALIGKIAVCDGYTKAAQLLLDRLGIENEYVVGTIKGGGLHSWNLVKLNGQYYFMDVTWDDPAPNKPGYVGYDYFLVTSEQLSKDHSWDQKEWPVATSKLYSNFGDFRNLVEVDNLYFYSSQSDSDKLYQSTKQGTNKKRINNVRAPYFVIVGDWIYFSNYSSGGHLYKMKKDGTSMQKLNSIHVVDLRVVGNELLFTEYQSKKTLKFALSK